MRNYYFIVSFSGIVLSLFHFTATAQAIDNTLSFRNIQSDHYTRINYENDFFTGTDRDYTQGIYVEFVRPSLRHFPLTKLLWKPGKSVAIYGLAIEDDGYTPNYIDRYDIQYGDRPYAGVLFLKTFVTAINEERRERITTILSTGIIGQSAGGEGMQKAIHHWIHYTQPLGWHNQVRNDVVLNYQLNDERELLAYRNYFSLASYASFRLGTLSTKATAGVTMMLGNFYPPFSLRHTGATKKLQYYFYDQPAINAVGYDATLQGGLFNHSSPYTISNNNINRLVLQNRFGFILIFKHLSLEYYQSAMSPEFTTSVHHRSGGLQVGFGF